MYIYIYIYIYDSQIVHHNHCFNLFILHSNPFDNEGSKINKNDIFLRTVRHTVFYKNFLPTHIYIYIYIYKYIYIYIYILYIYMLFIYISSSRYAISVAMISISIN